MFGTNSITGKSFFKTAPTDSLFVTSVFFTLQGEGPFNGLPALFIRLAKCNLACSFCFVPSTKITMANGKTKQIDQIKIGDEVMSWDKDKIVPKKVTRTYTSVADKIVKVNSSGEPVWCTPDHPFLTSNRGWVNAEDLIAGDKIVHWTLSEQKKVFNPLLEPANPVPMHQEAKDNAAKNPQHLCEDPEFREKDIARLTKVAEFIHNDRVVVNVEFVNPDDSSGWARLYGSETAERIVHNFEVEDTHTYIANGCVVHNCDTFFDAGDWMTFDEIAVKVTDTIRKYWLDRGLKVPDWADTDQQKSIGCFPGIVLVVTGGEPLLQKNLMDFLNYSKSMFNNMQIESNGTVNQNVPEHVTLVCSPKCSEKNGVATKYLAPSELILKRADCLKFVMNADTDSPYNSVPDWAKEWHRETGRDIYISPMNIYNDLPHKIKILRLTTPGNITIDERSSVDETIDFWEPGLLNMSANEINHKYAARYCIDHGFRLNLQMHLYAGLA